VLGWSSSGGGRSGRGKGGKWSLWRSSRQTVAVRSRGGAIFLPIPPTEVRRRMRLDAPTDGLFWLFIATPAPIRLPSLSSYLLRRSYRRFPSSKGLPRLLYRTPILAQDRARARQSSRADLRQVRSSTLLRFGLCSGRCGFSNRVNGRKRRGSTEH
jgi:hypothetical protein